MLTIAKWGELYENADTRKRQRLKFFYCPSGNDSNGYLELASSEGGMEAFGIFMAICQWSATQPKNLRGKLVRANGEKLSIQDIATRIRVETCRVDAACKLLTSRNIGWLIDTESEKSADPLPEICRESASFVQREGQGQGQREREREVPLSRSSADYVSERQADGRAIAKRIMSLAPPYSVPTHLTAAEMRAITDDMPMFAAITDDQWRLVSDYCQARHPQGAGFWVPRTRTKLVESFADVLGHSTRWAEKKGVRINSGAKQNKSKPLPESFVEWHKQSSWADLGPRIAWMTEKCREEWKLATTS